MNTSIRGLLKGKTFFIAKLFALIIVFFLLVVWLYFAYAPRILGTITSMLGRADVLAEEVARLDSLGSFLSALLHGNLGYSFHYGQPVWSILVDHLGMTALLIAISIAISGAVGALVASVASRFGSRGNMPLVSSYSLKGYFFALTMWTGMILILLFSLHLGWFPAGHTEPDYWLIYPPENIFVEIGVRLSHLALPMLTLTIIFLIRSFFVVWSGGVRFISGQTLRNLLLPLTATDFACIVSAVVLIEYVFYLPGVGWLLFMSFFADPIMMGAFLVLLAIAVILGCVAVLFDFVRQRYSLPGESEKRTCIRTESKERPKQNVTNMRLKGLLRLSVSRKSMFVGLVITCSFIIIGVTAPLLTPYDPVSVTVTPKIAYSLSMPVWYGYLFPGENVSENIDVTSDPYFRSAEAIEKLTFETTLAHQGSIHTEYVSDKGFPDGSGPGCLAIVFEREADVAPYGEVKVNLTAAFNYPYSFPPKQFLGDVAVLVDNSQGGSVEFNVVLGRTGSSRMISWAGQSFTPRVEGWITPYPRIDSNDFHTKDWLGETFGSDWSRFPARAMFSESGDYRFSIEIVFEDTQPGASNVKVYVDDFFLRVYGNSFGVFGTDEYGRDIFSQILYGARNILIITVPMAVVAALIGLALGFAATYFGNLIDNLVKLFVDTTLALPIVPLLVVVSWTLWSSPLDWALLWVLSALAATASRTAYATRKGEKALAGSFLRGRLLSLFKDLSANFCFVMASLTLLSLIGSFGFYSPWLGPDFRASTWGGMLGGALYSASLFRGLWLWVPPLSCTLLFAAGFFLIGLGLDKRLQFS
jgi:peptide/nickel transport system permease protein